MKLLILFLFSINIHAGYMSKIKMMDCESSGRTFYLKSSSCQENHNDCISLPKDFHCETFSELDTSVDDKEKPKHSKNEIEVCANQDDCKSKLPPKICTDEAENKYINSGYSEIYCSKLTGYNQKIVKKIREDSTKKAVFDANEAAKNQIKIDSKNERDAAKALISKLESGSNLTDAERRQVFIEVLKELRD